MNGRTEIANSILRMLAGWLVAVAAYFAGYHWAAVWIASIFTGLFVLQYACISLFRHHQRKKAVLMQRRREKDGLGVGGPPAQKSVTQGQS